MKPYRITQTITIDGVSVEVIGLYTPAIPATGPSYSSGGEPPEPADFEPEKATIGGVDVTELFNSVYVRKLAKTTVYDDIWNIVCEKVLEDYTPEGR